MNITLFPPEVAASIIKNLTIYCDTLVSTNKSLEKEYNETVKCNKRQSNTIEKFREDIDTLSMINEDLIKDNKALEKIRRDLETEIQELKLKLKLDQHERPPCYPPPPRRRLSSSSDSSSSNSSGDSSSSDSSVEDKHKHHKKLSYYRTPSPPPGWRRLSSDEEQQIVDKKTVDYYGDEGRPVELKETFLPTLTFADLRKERMKDIRSDCDSDDDDNDKPIIFEDVTPPPHNDHDSEVIVDVDEEETNTTKLSEQE